MSFNQKEYVSSFNKETYKMFPFRVRKDNKEVIEKLNEVPNKNKYIVDLIESSIKSSTLTIKQIKDVIMPILHEHKIFEIYLFGSYARGEANNNSDVDIYCESGDIRGLIDQGHLEDQLEKALGKEIDIVFIGSKMDDYFKEQLEKDLIKLC